MSAYLTVTATRNEVEERLAQLAADYPQLCTRIQLPLPTAQFRVYSALRIGLASPIFPRGVLFTGGLHGDEWGGADICVSFAEKILAAIAGGTGLAFAVGTVPPKTFTAAEVATVANRLQLFILPLANPDGRAANTRKNSRQVDLARNFDFLWDNPYSGGATAREHKNYRGRSQNSERETLNIISLVDEYPIISRMVDIHTRSSGGPIVAYHWAHDEAQTTDPGMNFTKAAANNWKVGVRGDAYREYISPKDYQYVKQVADNMAAAINSVAAGDYLAIPGINYGNSANGVSGVSTDYFFSRHMTDPSKRKVYGWLVEYGRDRLNDELNPDTAEMADIIQEVNAGMMQVCLDSVQELPFLLTVVTRFVKTVTSFAGKLLQSIRRRHEPAPIPPPRPMSFLRGRAAAAPHALLG